VYLQPDGSVALSLSPVFEEDLETVCVSRFNTLSEGVKVLEENFEDSFYNYGLMWEEFESFIDRLVSCKSDSNSFSKETIFSFIDSIHHLCLQYDDLKEVSEKIEMLSSKVHNICPSDICTFGYYVTMLSSVDGEIVEEANRIADIKEVSKSYKIAKGSKKIVEAIGYGIEEGIGPSGRNNPFGNFDTQTERVMDGREIGEGKGHAIEKFKRFNKFKRYPEFIKKNLKYRRKKHLRHNPNRKRKPRNKKIKRSKHRLGRNGYVQLTLKDDPTFMIWHDDQRNSAYSWDDRGANGVYPTRSNYSK
jgi:hypothetical protein